MGNLGFARRGGLAFLLLLIAVGALVRFHGLDTQSLWRDEIETRVFADGGWREVTRTSLTTPQIPVPPLWIWITKACRGTSSVWALRFPAALSGVLLIPAVWLLAGEAAGPQAALLAALFTTLSPFLIRYSQEARSYALLALLPTLAAFFLLRAVRAGRRADWAGFVACGLLGAYTHHFALLPLAGGFGYLLWSAWRAQPGVAGWRTAVRSWPAWAALALLYLPMVGFLAKGLLSPRGLDLESAGGEAVGDPGSLFRVVGPMANNLVWLFLLLALAGAVLRSTWKPGGRALALFSILAPTAAVIIIPFHHAVRLRYLIYLLPIYYLLAAVGLAGLFNWARGKILRLAVPMMVVAAIVSFSARDLLAYYGENKQDWKSVSAFLARVAAPDDLILVDGRSPQRLNLRYRVLDLYAGLGPRVRIMSSRRDAAHVAAETPPQAVLWYVNTMVSGREGPATFFFGQADELRKSGWRILPAMKFDVPRVRSAGELAWIGETRYRSLVVVAAMRRGDRAPLEARYLAAARAVTANLDPNYSTQTTGQAGQEQP